MSNEPLLTDTLLRMEQAAAAAARGLAGDHPSWGELLAAAQISLVAPDNVESVVRQRTEAGYAARILTSAAMNDVPIEAEDKRPARLLAAGGFATVANYPSSHAVAVPLTESDYAGLSDVEVGCLALYDPRVLGAVAARLEGTAMGPALEHVLSFLEHGTSDSLDMARSIVRELIMSNTNTSFEIGLLAVALDSIDALNRFGLVSAHEANALPVSEEYVQRLVADGVFTLLPPQYEALVDARLLADSRNALITMPTSSGKTLLGELMIDASLSDGAGWSCYVTPYLALGRQVASTLTRRSARHTVLPLLGGFVASPGDADFSASTIVVATPERLDNLLRQRPELLGSLRCVVFDEAHMVQSGVRGARLEGLVARLRLQQVSGRGFRIAMISAVIDNINPLVAWLGGPDLTTVIRSRWRPTARRVFLWDRDGAFQWFLERDGDKPAGQAPGQVVARTSLPWPETEIYATDNYGARTTHLPRAARNVSYLIRYLLAREEGSVLCICSSRASSRLVARTLAAATPVNTPVEANVVGRLTDLISSRYPHLADLRVCLERGVAYHNASLPIAIREGIEDAVAAGELTAVCATTTLAEGVDLPFRYTVLHDWQMYGPDGLRPIDPLLFRNIAGRSGRAGAHTDGDVVVWENPVGSERYARNSVIRRSLAGAVLPDNVVLNSSLEERAGRLGDDVAAVLASQFVAAIAENPDIDELDTALARVTYAAHRDLAAQRMISALAKARTDVLDDARGALGVASSPIRLTALGRGALRSGFSPDSARSIVAEIASLQHDQDLPSVGAQLLTRLATLPEHSNDKFTRKIVAPKSRYLVAEADVPFTIAVWLSGAELADVFQSLPYVRRSRRTPSADDWLAGTATSDSWTDEFDRLSDFFSESVVSFLPWLFRAAEAFTEEVATGAAAAVIPWSEWARLLELGVSTPVAAWLLDEHQHMPRTLATAIGNAIERSPDLDAADWSVLPKERREELISAAVASLRARVEQGSAAGDLLQGLPPSLA